MKVEQLLHATVQRSSSKCCPWPPQQMAASVVQVSAKVVFSTALNLRKVRIQQAASNHPQDFVARASQETGNIRGGYLLARTSCAMAPWRLVGCPCHAWSRPHQFLRIPPPPGRGFINATKGCRPAALRQLPGYRAGRAAGGRGKRPNHDGRTQLASPWAGRLVGGASFAGSLPSHQASKNGLSIPSLLESAICKIACRMLAAQKANLEKRSRLRCVGVFTIGGVDHAEVCGSLRRGAQRQRQMHHPL